MMDGVSGVVRRIWDLLNIFTQRFERIDQQKCMSFSESKKKGKSMAHLNDIASTSNKVSDGCSEIQNEGCENVPMKTRWLLLKNLLEQPFRI